MRKLITGGVVALLVASGGVSFADHAGTNPTDPEAIGSHPALYGLCTAWHANENGRDNGRADEAPPFAALEQAAEDEGQSVSEFCADATPGGSHGPGDGSGAPAPDQHPRNNGNGNGGG